MKITKFYKQNKNLLLPVIVFLVTMYFSDNLMAKQLDEFQVKQAVETWVHEVTKNARPDARITNLESYPDKFNPIAYIAYLSDSGFCICGADDRQLPVYVYSPAGIFDPENDFYKFFLNMMSDWLIKINDLESRNDPDLGKYSTDLYDIENYWTDLASGVVNRVDKGLYDGPDSMTLDLTSNWRQNSPYNCVCPTLPPGSDHHCAVGCVAGAMAAVMRYWEWPETGVGTGSVDYYYQYQPVWDEEPLSTEVTIPTDWSSRLEWIPDEGGKLRLTGYWDWTVKSSAEEIRPNYIFVGTYNGKICSSIKNGDHWAPRSNGIHDSITAINSIAFNSYGHIFAATPYGMYRSTNRGVEWFEINSGLSSSAELDVRVVLVNYLNDVYIGTDDGVFRFNSIGDSWDKISTGITNRHIRSLLFFFGSYLLAGTDNCELYRSDDHGNSWNPVEVGSPCTDLGTPTQTLAISATLNPDIFLGTEYGLYRSTNNGYTWDQIGTGLTDDDVNALTFNSSDHVFAATPSGVFRSTDNGDNWTLVNNNLSYTNVTTVGVSLYDEVFVGTYPGGVHRSSDNGNSWSDLSWSLGDKDIKTMAMDFTWYPQALQALIDRLPDSQYTTYNVDYGATTYQWDQIQDQHSDPVDATDIQVGILMHHAGVSVNMKYGLYGSGAVSLVSPYVNNFRYDSDIELAEREIGAYGSGHNDMMEEIQWLRPIHYKNDIDVHAWVIFGYDRTYLPENVQWDMHRGNGTIDFCSFNPWYESHVFIRNIAPIDVVKFVGSTSSGDGSPAQPYQNVETAVSAAPDGATLIFKAGSVNTFAASDLIVNKELVLKGVNVVIKKE